MRGASPCPARCGGRQADPCRIADLKGAVQGRLETPFKSRKAMFIALKIKAKSVYHGYDEDGKLIIEPVGSTEFVEKLIKIDRILSFTEDYIFIECPHDTAQTWEYEGTLADIKAKLASISALV
jgi:hypothetical protein